jgi:hypothetical protein
VLEELRRRQAMLEAGHVGCSSDDLWQREAQQSTSWAETEQELEQAEEAEEVEESDNEELWFAQSVRYERWYERRDASFGVGMRAYKLMLAEWDRQQQQLEQELQ